MRPSWRGSHGLFSLAAISEHCSLLEGEAQNWDCQAQQAKLVASVSCIVCSGTNVLPDQNLENAKCVQSLTQGRSSAQKRKFGFQHMRNCLFPFKRMRVVSIFNLQGSHCATPPSCQPLSCTHVMARLWLGPSRLHIQIFPPSELLVVFSLLHCVPGFILSQAAPHPNSSVSFQSPRLCSTSKSKPHLHNPW